MNHDAVLTPRQEATLSEKAQGLSNSFHFLPSTYTMPWLLGNNPFPFLPPSLIALSKSPQWLFQGVTIFSSLLADLYHSFELETSPNSPSQHGKEDPSPALYTAPSPNPFLTTLLCHELKPWSSHPYSVPHSAPETFPVSPRMMNSHFSRGLQTNLRMPRPPQAS